MDYLYSFHLFDEREFRERFLPAAQGDEPIVREFLEAADASGPHWTALHKLFDELRTPVPGQPPGIEHPETELVLVDGPSVQRKLLPAFAQLVTHLRPAFCVKGVGFTHIDRDEFPKLARHLRSPGLLLLDADRNPLPGVPAHLPEQVADHCLDGRSTGAYLPRDDVRAFLKDFRAEMPRLKRSFEQRGLPAEPAITVMLAAIVDAKLRELALLEACQALVTDDHMPRDHRLSFEQPRTLPLAVLREAGKLFGREVPLSSAAESSPEEAPPSEAVPYSPARSYELGQRVAHKAFGTGEVTQVLDSRRLVVRFDDQERTLAQGMQLRRADSNGGDGETEGDPAP